MPEYMHLVGAEQIQSAASRMASAADEMQRAASTIDNALDRHAQRFEEAQMRRDEADSALNPEAVTLRDYFMAHAPAEPQPWFRPVMAKDRPTLPTFPTDQDASKQAIDYVREYADVMDPDDAATPALRVYVVACRAQRRAIAEYDAECQKLFYTQWPAAWADAVLKARA